MTYEELKTRNRKAHSALISLWEELSRTSRSVARKDLKDDWGWRYAVKEHSGKVRVWKYPETIGGPLEKDIHDHTLEFLDSHAGQSFYYVEARNEWV